MTKISNIEQLKKLLTKEILNQNGAITITINAIAEISHSNDIVGNCLQEWLPEWFEDNGLKIIATDKTQEFPDFTAYFEDEVVPIDIKCWNYENSPAFDIANFDSFYNVLYNDPKKLFAKYMTIGYVPTKHGFTIKYTDIKSLAELLGPSKKYPIGLQVKRGRPYAVRPANFKKKDYKHFENLDELILAVKDTRDMFPLSREEEKYTSTQWLEKLKEEINRYK
ncbi:NgoBV family restriction endonuclease [Lactobacillus delbrueckii subsp. bulgaricus]|nr:hypothetical protein [Lactobacillus delbrueckii subsp. bulgaricus]MBT8920068.1 hypothetical protein [Lactobacillus delbrueckii subsp. bulgaricus]